MTLDVIIVNAAYFLTFTALAVREIYWLRIILTLAQLGQLTHAYMNVDFSKGIWTCIFITINIYQIVMIYLNRRELAIPEEIRDLYENIFHTQSNREFLNFWDMGRVCQIEKGSLIKAGDMQSDLMLILNGKADVIRDGKQVVTLERGQFIAEISYITNNPVSADVMVNDELLFYTWSRDTLEKLRKSSPIIMAKLDRILTLDMAGKLTR